jgi:DnaJ-class molecular chaperone
MVVPLKYTQRELNPASGSPHVINYDAETRQQTCKACGPLGELTKDASAHAAVTAQCPWCLGRGGDTYTNPSLPPGWTCTRCGGDGHINEGIPLPLGVQELLAAQKELILASTSAATRAESVFSRRRRA